MTTITAQHIRAWLERSAQTFEAQKGYLSDLDSPIGDADHGTNMARGFAKAVEKLMTTPDADISALLKAVSMTLMSTVGGASGPLYGTFFLRASAAAASKAELTLSDLAALLRAGMDGIVQRGRAEPGDKTMIDALLPAVDALKASADQGVDLVTALDACVSAAEAGMQATIPLQARKGRASYLGERSIGHQDPGATSVTYLLAALRDAVMG